MNWTKKIYFIYFEEDYLYSNDYRTKNISNNIFYEILELEEFINKKYKNIDYNIIYFTFKENNIPSNSNIVNIILTTTNLYNKPYGCSIEELRKYCAKILASLFNTEINFNWDKNVFLS